MRVDTERAVAVIGNAGLEFMDADLGQHRFAGDRKAVADEGDIGIHVGGRRPIGVEFHAHVLQRGAGVEHASRHRAGRRSERPVLQFAGDHRTPVAHLSGDQRGVEPMHERRRHHVFGPETLGGGCQRIVEIGGDIDPRRGAVVLEPQPAAHVGAITVAVDAQRRRFDPPAAILAPADRLAAQPDDMHHAETARPVEAQLRFGIERERHRFGIAAQIAAEALQTRRVTDRGELQVAHARFDADVALGRAAAQAADVHPFQHRAGPGCRQPPTNVRIELIAEREHREQGAGVDAFGAQAVALAAREDQTIENLRLAVGLGMNLHAGRIQAPAVGLRTPVCDRLQARERGDRRGVGFRGGGLRDGHPGYRRGRERRAAQAHAFQIAVDADRSDAMPTQTRPGFGAAAPLDDGHAVHVQQRRPRRQIGVLRRCVDPAVTGAAVEVQHEIDRRTVAPAARAQPTAHAFAVDLQAQIDVGDHGFDLQRRRGNAQTRVDHLQLAQTFQRAQRIAALRLSRQPTHLPAAVVGAFERQREIAHAQLGERTSRQQAGVLRHQDFGGADGHRVLARAHAQTVEAQQRPAPGPRGLNGIELHRPAGARAQPFGDAIRMPLGQRQQLTDDACA